MKCLRAWYLIVLNPYNDHSNHPAYNEAACIAETVQRVLNEQPGFVSDVIVVDGGSTDGTIKAAHEAEAKVIASPKKGRAAQMNEGARHAITPVLYFLHADSIPPPGFSKQIAEHVKKGYSSGCYRLAFNHKHWFLQLNCWFTRFDVNAVRFGDQSLFVTKAVFTAAGGFREDHIVMEDQEIIARLKKHGKFKVMDGSVTTSARKYLDNGIYRMQGIFFRIWLMYKLGQPQEKLVNTYRKLITQDKV